MPPWWVVEAQKKPPGRPRLHANPAASKAASRARLKAKKKPISPRTLRKRAQRAQEQAEPSGERVVLSSSATVLCKDMRALTSEDIADASLDVIITERLSGN